MDQDHIRNHYTRLEIVVSFMAKTYDGQHVTAVSVTEPEVKVVEYAETYAEGQIPGEK
jgi:hypothetical protein